jgi:hypothetical protein
MSAPTAERTRAARSTRPSGPAGARRSAGVPAPRDADGAVRRAYAKRAGRARRLTAEPGEGSPPRSRFVLMVMGLLGVGLVASLWLSTTAAADSYRLDDARQATQVLSERSEALRTEIAAMQAPPALAAAAQRMGMVPSTDVARLVAMPDGSVRVVGTPKAATAAPPPSPALATGAQPAPSRPEPDQSASGPAQTAPAQPQGPAQPTDQQPTDQQPTGQQPTDQQPTDQQPVDERLPEEQLAAPLTPPAAPPSRAEAGIGQ